MCSLLLSGGRQCTIGCGSARSPVAKCATLTRVREHLSMMIMIAPRWLEKHWLAEIIQLLAVHPLPGEWGNFPPSSGAHGYLALANERFQFSCCLSTVYRVVETIQGTQCTECQKCCVSYRTFSVPLINLDAQTRLHPDILCLLD